MARLRKTESPGDPDFAQSQGRGRGAAAEKTTTTSRDLRSQSPVNPRTSPRKKAVKSYLDDFRDISGDELESSPRLLPKISSPSPKRGKQIRLKPLNAISTRKPLNVDLVLDDSQYKPQNKPRRSNSPKKSYLGATAPVKTGSATESVESCGSSEELEVEESIWCGSDEASDESEEELPSPRKFLRLPPREPNRQKSGAVAPLSDKHDLSGKFNQLSIFHKPFEAGLQPGAPDIVPAVSSRPGSSSDKENDGAFLRFSPPRLHSPPKRALQNRPATPPQSPSRSRLQSPSKTRSRVPTPPHRQSLDAFWNADTVNGWNDQYSPQKVLKSPRKLKFLQDDADASPTSSPRKCQSPSKRTKAEVEAKKSFDCRKRTLADEFLAELDTIITGGQIQGLAKATGGVHFVWSKTLNSTAGRANWRRETTKSRQLDGTTHTTHKHHASVELAEKVIDDENRLLNVIAHEFCHLANFMISGIKDQPHGRQFKEWGRKVTVAFGDRGVEVTTKHSYQIEYKYIWQCSNDDCAVEFKRHSKSIDPKRHTCGTCRSKLVQIKPVPRKDAGTGTGYSAFVKTHFAAVKRSMPGCSQKEVMEALGRKYRQSKASNEAANEIQINISGDGAGGPLKPKEAAEVDNVARVLEFVTIDDD